MMIQPGSGGGVRGTAEKRWRAAGRQPPAQWVLARLPMILSGRARGDGCKTLYKLMCVCVHLSGMWTCILIPRRCMQVGSKCADFLAPLIHLHRLEHQNHAFDKTVLPGFLCERFTLRHAFQGINAEKKRDREHTGFVVRFSRIAEHRSRGPEAQLRTPERVFFSAATWDGWCLMMWPGMSSLCFQWSS